MREGVCCTCQSTHPVRHKGRGADDDLLGFRDEDFDGEAGEWVMDTHDAFGSHCDGSGTMPQALVKESSDRDEAPPQHPFRRAITSTRTKLRLTHTTDVNI